MEGFFSTKLASREADPLRPSYFEMWTQDRLVSTLRPAIRYVTTILARRNPRLEPLVQYNDELFLATQTLLELHYLRNYDGTFAHNFYGLRIVPASGRRFSSRDIPIVLLFDVLLPYVRVKLDAIHKELDAIYNRSAWSGPVFDDAVAEPTARQRRERVFVKFYPIVRSIYEASAFACQLLYLYEFTKYFSPSLYLQRFIVNRVGPRETAAYEQQLTAKRLDRLTRLEAVGYVGPLLALCLRTWHGLLDSSKYIFPVSIFLFKFLEWWFATPRVAPVTMPTPPPPALLSPSPEGIEIPENKELCPLCLRPRTNATVAPSGFAFCYPCIFKHVSENECCPITLQQTAVDQLRKIYETT